MVRGTLPSNYDGIESSGIQKTREVREEASIALPKSESREIRGKSEDDTTGTCRKPSVVATKHRSVGYRIA